MKNQGADPLATRWTLLSRLKDWQDQESWRQFFDLYSNLIYHTSLKAGLNHTEAQEVVQETVLTVAKKMPEFRADPQAGSFKGWLLTITRWRIGDQFRKRPRNGPTPRPSGEDTARTATVERIPDPTPDVNEATWDEEWERNLLAVAAERLKKHLKPEVYQVYDLLIHRKWSALKIAQRLNIPLTRVYYAKYKSMALAKREIRRLRQEAQAFTPNQ